MLIAKNFLTAWPSYKPSYLTSCDDLAGGREAGRIGASHGSKIGARTRNCESAAETNVKDCSSVPH
jgi:hypothetical protein